MNLGNKILTTFTITNRMTLAITRIERARGFFEAAQLSADWVREVGEQALIREAHHTTHIEGTRLTLDQAERLWRGEAVRRPIRTMRGSCSTTAPPSSLSPSAWTAATRSPRG